MHESLKFFGSDIEPQSLGEIIPSEAIVALIKKLGGAIRAAHPTSNIPSDSVRQFFAGAISTCSAAGGKGCFLQVEAFDGHGSIRATFEADDADRAASAALREFLIARGDADLLKSAELLGAHQALHRLSKEAASGAKRRT